VDATIGTQTALVGEAFALPPAAGSERRSKSIMVPHTCRACGHVFGENNAFVLKSRCCPRCGARVAMKRGARRPLVRIAVAAGLLMVIVTVYLITSSLLQL
jgi:hypothetical protein